MRAVRQVARARSAACGARPPLQAQLNDALRVLAERDSWHCEDADSNQFLHQGQLPYQFADAAFRNASREYEELSQAFAAQQQKLRELSAANAAQAREMAVLRAGSIEKSVYQKLYKRTLVQAACDAEQRAEIQLLRTEITHLQRDRTSEQLQAQIGQLKQKISDMADEAFKSKQLAAQHNFNLQQTITRLETQYFALQQQAQKDAQAERERSVRETERLLQELDSERKKTARLQESLTSAREACARTSKGLAALAELQAQMNQLSLENMELHNALDEGAAERQALSLQLEGARTDLQRGQRLGGQIAALGAEISQIREKLAAVRKNAAEKPAITLQNLQQTVELACAGSGREQTALQRNVYSSAQLVAPAESFQQLLNEQRETSATLLEELQREKRANFELQLRASTLQRNIDAYESENLREQNSALEGKCRGLEENLRRLAQQQTSDQAQIQQLLRRLQRAQRLQQAEGEK